MNHHWLWASTKQSLSVSPRCLLSLTILALWMALQAPLLSGAPFVPTDTAHRKWQRSQTDAIREAVFRYQMQQKPIGGNNGTDPIFFLRFRERGLPSAQFLDKWRRHKPPARVVETDDPGVFRAELKRPDGHGWEFAEEINFSKSVDPDPAFLRRFQGQKPLVKAASQSVMSSYPVDRQTGAAGIILELAEPSWITENEVDITGTRIAGDVGGESGVYHVTYVNKSWVVSAFRLKSIS